MAYLCKNPENWKGQVVRIGHCVPFVQKAAGALAAKQWSEGDRVSEVYLTLAAGTAIATFVDGKYPSNKTGNHAAIFVSADANGIAVWDQWLGQPVHERTMRFRHGKGSPSNDASAFSVIE